MPHRALTVTVGLPGSGKSTWTREQIMAAPPGEAVRLNQDSLREMLHFGRYAHHLTEGAVTAIEQKAARLAFITGARWVIVDDTNLMAIDVHQWYVIARSVGASFNVRSFLDVPLQTCINRDSGRRGLAHVGETKIRAMHQAHYDQALHCVNLAREGRAPFDEVRPA